MEKNHLLKKINAEEIQIGRNVIIEDNVIITGKEGAAEKVVIGDNVFIGSDTKIIVPKLIIGDYSQIHNHTLAHGWKPLQIGRNFWIGQHSILDSIGGLDIDDHVSIGAMSHIWTHFKSGDYVEGCRFHSKKYLHINEDVWLAPNCLISPVKIGKKSMALMGSVIQHNMKSNHIYSGNPAIDITDKIGKQFRKRTIQEKYNKLNEVIKTFENKYPKYKKKLIVVKTQDDFVDDKTCFDVSTRTYTKRLTKPEITFLKENGEIKFIPFNEVKPFELQSK